MLGPYLELGEHNMPTLGQKTVKVVPTPLAETAPTAPPALKVLNPTVELKCGNCGSVLMHGDRSKTGPLIVHCLSCQLLQFDGCLIHSTLATPSAGPTEVHHSALLPQRASMLLHPLATHLRV